MVAIVVHSGIFDSCINSQKTSDRFKSVSSSLHTADLEAGTSMNHSMPSHSSQRSRKFSMDELTRRISPVLKGEMCNGHCQMDSSHRKIETRYRSKSSGNGGSVGTNNGGDHSEFDTDDGARSSASGNGWAGGSSSGGYSSLALKHDPLLRYKIPKLITTSTVAKGRHSLQSLKQEPITSGSKIIPAFDCDNDDPLAPSKSAYPPKTETKLHDMSNNCAILTPSLSPKLNSVPSISSPTLTSKSLDESASDPQGLVRKALDVHFDKGTITNRQYKRILERATRKVKDGLVQSSCMNENRVRKLVSDFVKAYKYQGKWV